jgi:hypothetical protein
LQACREGKTFLEITLAMIKRIAVSLLSLLIAVHFWKGPMSSVHEIISMIYVHGLVPVSASPAFGRCMSSSTGFPITRALVGGIPVM